MRRLGFVFVWLVTAGVATALAWTVLSSADREVGVGPQTPVLVVTEGGSTSVPAPGPTTTSITTSTTTTTRPAPTGSGASTSSTTSTTTSPTTTTTVPITTTSSSPPTTAAWQQATVPSAGGVVVVSHRPGEVRLESATPAAGFSMEIDEDGPDEVRVEFEGDDQDYEIRVRWNNGSLQTEVDS